MGVLKLGLISLGIILGIYFKTYLAQLLWLWWAIFAVSAAYFIGKMVQGSDMSTAKPKDFVKQTEAMSAQSNPKLTAPDSVDHSRPEDTVN
jgi:hypothetical protein